jgi:GTPase
LKLHSQPIDEHGEAPLADDGKLEEIVAQFDRRKESAARPGGTNACYVVCIGRDALTRDAEVAEILGLVHAQGDEVVGHEVYQPRQLNARTLIGRGACEAIAGRAQACGANLLVIDAEITPSQARNLEDVTGMSIADREGVILNVFLRHARTRKARMQVEIAHLEYLRPRIRGLGLDMDQQAGGVMGSRGPGETASELLARHLDDKLIELRKALARLERSSGVQRESRNQCRRIVLLGYTNAGKTTLMNGIAGTSLSAKDMPFETLDTTSRCLTRHGGEVVLSDTVGFIRRLPERLLASFASTLDEARDASLLALVVDLSDPEWRTHLGITETILAKLGAQTSPRYYVFNKLDRLASAPSEAELRAAAGDHPFTCVSGHDPLSMTMLRDTLVAAVRRDQTSVEVFAPYAAAQAMALIYGRCRIESAVSDERGVAFTIAGDRDVLTKIEHLLAEHRS